MIEIDDIWQVVLRNGDCFWVNKETYHDLKRHIKSEPNDLMIEFKTCAGGEIITTVGSIAYLCWTDEEVRSKIKENTKEIEKEDKKSWE